MHAQHACAAARAGKHVLVEKPMALTLSECEQMIAAARSGGVQLMVGHSHSYNAPVQRATQIIASGELGSVRMLHAFNYTDFLYRPRRPEELSTAQGGGVIFSQAAHQIDVLRMLACAQGHQAVRSVRAHTGNWDATRPTEGAYSALLQFEGGCFASATYSGYAHYDSDALMGWVGELGQSKSPSDYGAARKRLAATEPAHEQALKAQRNYGGSMYQPSDASAPPSNAHQHFGHVLVSCEKGDLRLTPFGVECFTDGEQRVETLPPPQVPRFEVIDALWDCIRGGRPALHSGKWSRDTLAVCLALLQSAREQRDIIPD